MKTKSEQQAFTFRVVMHTSQEQGTARLEIKE